MIIRMPMIIPSRKYRDVDLSGSIGMRGHLTFLLRRDGRTIFAGQSDDMIVDDGIANICSASSSLEFFDYCLLGTGATPPTTTDVALAAPVYATAKYRSSAEVGVQSAVGDYYLRKTFEYNLTDAIGTWSEVGIYCQRTPNAAVYAAGRLIDRSLIKDSNGNPTTVVKTSSDTLTIVYDLHMIRPSAAPTTQTITVNGNAVVINSLITEHGLESLTGKGASYNQNHSLSANAQSRLGTGTSGYDIESVTAANLISTPPSIAQRVQYVPSTSYIEYMYEFPAAVTGAISEFKFGMSSNNASTGYPLAFFWWNPIQKTDTNTKIRIQPRITFNRS